MNQTKISLCGELTPSGHRLVQRVYYEDTDFSGVVYHARYLHFLERGRTDFIRCLGVTQVGMQDAGEELFFVVHRMEIDFKASARMDDILTVLTRIEKAAGAKLVLGQQILRGDQVLIEAKAVIAVINKASRPRRIPAEITSAFLTSQDG